MFIMHIALQGCLRSKNVRYGLTPDTGGHIRYVLDLVRALELGGAAKQQVVVRRFSDERLGMEYASPSDPISPDTEIIRIAGGSVRYLAKEQLYTEHEALWASLRRHLNSLPAKPDLIHAHYADAGELAIRAKEEFGIPFFFTPHSLGRVKAQTLASDEQKKALRTRIDTEERVISRANRVIVSSRDEADVQLRQYGSTDPAKVRVIPPGCHPEMFAADRLFRPDVERSIARFLDDAAKPPILAIARPIWKKNLHGLVKAFGESKELQRNANLVIVAGCRERLANEDAETRNVLRTLLELIDDYDLYGKVAIPKQHEPNDIPDIYSYAAALRGVFVNPAFNEPFGLTLLEAAASGLPVVATNSGGPTDIIERLDNGICVAPASPTAISGALLSLLQDEEEWKRLAANGQGRIEAFSWREHAHEYFEEAAATLRPKRYFVHGENQFSRLLVSDIDNTLIGCGTGLREFGEWQNQQTDYCFAIATGRGIHSATNILRRHRTPSPAVLVTGVGSDIFYAHDDALRDFSFDEEWRARICENWDADAVSDALTGVKGVSFQPLIEQSAVKQSFFVDCPERRDDIVARLQEVGLEATVILSHERYLDVLPRAASKGDALRYLADKLGVIEKETVAAGDSGNDEQMLRMAGMGVVVANHSQELTSLCDHPTAYFARRPYAAGVVEGLRAHAENR